MLPDSQVSWVILALLTCSPVVVHADVATFVPTRDAMLIETGLGDLASGSVSYLCVGNTNQGGSTNTRRALLYFDVSSQIPLGSVINSATLTLHMSQTNAGIQNVALHRVLSNWGEGISASGPCSGGGAIDDDATWRYTFYNFSAPNLSPSWMSLGGDFDPALSASALIGGDGFYSWSSVAMVADLQGWVDAPVTNFGWMLRGNETASPTAKRFDSRENSNVSFRPELVVDFTPGPPVGACCFIDGTCQVLTETDCLNAEGVFQGVGVSCIPNRCPQPTGACCFTDGVCVEVTEDDCGLQGGSYEGDFSACNPDLCPIILTPYLDLLPIPSVAIPISGTVGGAATYEISMTQFSHQVHAQLPPTMVWGYEGSYPGPTIETTRDQPIIIEWVNDLRDEQGVLRTSHLLSVDTCPQGPDLFGDSPRTVVQVDGVHVPSLSSGSPTNTILPGESVLLDYPNEQSAGTLWYHDNAQGVTRLNVYLGLLGMYVVRDQEESDLNLPSGPDEIPLIIQDRAFHPDGSFKYPEEWREEYFGDKTLVNGKVWPFLVVRRGKYRFRVLNASNSRTYRLSLSNGDSFQQIGSDSRLFAAALSVSDLTLAPSERADVIIDFGNISPGAEVLLVNDAPAPFSGGVAQGSSGTIPEVMKFFVTSQPGFTDPIPSSLIPTETLLESEAVEFREFELELVPEPCAGNQWLLGGQTWNELNEVPELGNVEVWSFLNRSDKEHSIGIELSPFQILDRQTIEIEMGQVIPTGPRIPPQVQESGWKDSMRCPPFAITRVITRFEDYVGVYTYHSENLERRDHAMLRQFESISPPRFIRGDANGDGALNVADPILALDYLFQGGSISCQQSADTNDDDAINIADPVSSLSYLFQMGMTPALPFPGCGSDPTNPILACDQFAACP